jgi:site-specific DNA-cytosine methylase
MRVLVACEFSGIVRQAFRARGHDAWSCDLLPSEDNSPNHYKCNIRHVIGPEWDMMIAFPPCTHLCVSGARWFPWKRTKQEEALDFVKWLLTRDYIERIALENPIGVISTKIRPPDQIIQPWQFGHGETKATCLWLKNIPPLVPTHVEDGDWFSEPAPKERKQRVFLEPPGPNRWKNRSRTYKGIAEAMANQWGRL